MTVSPEIRDRYRASWRTLIHGANAHLSGQGDAASLTALARYAMSATSWVAPSSDMADRATCGAFAWAVYAYAKQKSAARRVSQAAAVRAYAELVADMLDALALTDAPPPPRRPRADLDG